MVASYQRSPLRSAIQTMAGIAAPLWLSLRRSWGLCVLGATHVISVSVPAPPLCRPPADVFQVVRRCFQIMQRHSESGWRNASDLVLTPDLKSIEWNGFDAGPELVSAGEAAALAALPAIQSWFPEQDLTTHRIRERLA